MAAAADAVRQPPGARPALHTLALLSSCWVVASLRHPSVSLNPSASLNERQVASSCATGLHADRPVRPQQRLWVGRQPQAVRSCAARLFRVMQGDSRGIAINSARKSVHLVMQDAGSCEIGMAAAAQVCTGASGRETRGVGGHCDPHNITCIFATLSTTAGVCGAFRAPG